MTKVILFLIYVDNSTNIIEKCLTSEGPVPLSWGLYQPYAITFRHQSLFPIPSLGETGKNILPEGIEPSTFAYTPAPLISTTH